MRVVCNTLLAGGGQRAGKINARESRWGMKLQKRWLVLNCWDCWGCCGRKVGGSLSCGGPRGLLAVEGSTAVVAG